MNKKIVFNTLGKIILLQAALFIFPIIIALIYSEKSLFSFLISSGICLVLGLLLVLFVKPKSKNIFAKEGFTITALSWISLSVLGSLPFILSGEIPSFIDAFFETASGFSTTGATIVTDFSTLTHAILFWRSFTHWIGGMGVLVLIIAIFPSDSGRSIHIMRAEMPGPIVGKIVPKVRQTALILYLIYIGLTALEFVFLLFGGLSVFESLVYAVGTAGTGGFGILADSMASYSPYVQWVITAFMLLFGINFNLYFLILIKRAKQAFKSAELYCYFGIVLTCSAAICVNILPLFPSVADAIRQAVFQVSSIITTTGFGTSSINSWPVFSKAILLLLMFIGGCAGSTAGGLKVSRVMLLARSVRQDVQKMIHPRAVTSVQLEGKAIDQRTLSTANNYFILYCFILVILTVLLTIMAPEGFDFETNFSAAVSCFNNIGPAFGKAADSYAGFTGLSKILLAFSMLLGRLEIYPLLIGLSPSTWTRK